jgi:ubiquitin-like 1-activating enzyme E1 A
MTTTTTTATATTATTPSESDVYDRQIRLWGAEAQKKIQSSKVLYIHVTGSSSEVLKNLCLAGIKAEICDTRPASALDSSPCFFTHPNKNNNNEGEGEEQDQQQSPNKKIKYDSVAHAVRPLVEELNPLLGSCPILEKEVSELTQEDLKDYAVVIASRIPLDEAVRISQLLAKIATAEGSSNCVFYTIDCFGMRGASMIDFGNSDFRYRPEQGKKILDPISLKETVSLLEMAKVPLHKAINRFHKKGPPPTWVMYRALLEHEKQTGTWLGDVGMDADRAKKIISAFLKEQQSSLTDEELNDLVTAGMAQVAPVCAVLGGMVGNEVIKIISGKGEPANNTLLLDGGACKAWTFLVKAKE